MLEIKSASVCAFLKALGQPAKVYIQMTQNGQIRPSFKIGGLARYELLVPVDACPRKAAKDSGPWEGILQDGNAQGGSNSYGQSNFNSCKHDTKQGGIEHYEIQLINLQKVGGHKEAKTILQSTHALERVLAHRLESHCSLLSSMSQSSGSVSGITFCAFVI